KTKSFAKIQKLFDQAFKRVNTFIDMDTEVLRSSKKAEAAEGSSKRVSEEIEQESSKKQKVDNDQEAAHLKRCIGFVVVVSLGSCITTPLALGLVLSGVDGWKPKSLKTKSFAKIQKLFDQAFKRVNTFIDMDTEVVRSLKKAEAAKGSSKRVSEEIEQESSKKRKVDNDQEAAHLKRCMEYFQMIEIKGLLKLHPYLLSL
nr:hypothetical protein [Tanacetum cinerariifolium]